MMQRSGWVPWSHISRSTLRLASGFLLSQAIAGALATTPLRAQDHADSVAIAQIAAEFARDTLEVHSVHFRDYAALEGPRSRSVIAATGATFGEVDEVWDCQERRGADLCRWVGTEHGGGVVIEIGEWQFSEGLTQLKGLFVHLRSELALVEFYEWTLELRRDARGGWRIARATLITAF